MTTAAPSLGTFVTKPGYWFVTGVNQAGENVAGVVKYTGTGRLPNATQAIYVNGLNAKSLNTKALQAAIEKTRSTFLYEVPATGNHDNLQSIGARAIGHGQALYTSAQAGVQPVNDLYLATLLAVAPIAASVAGSSAAAGAGAAAAGEEAAAGAGGGAATAGTAAAGGGIGATATKLASKAASTVAGNASTILGGVAITALLTSTGLWKGVAMVIAGAILAFLALRQVAGAAA